MEHRILGALDEVTDFLQDEFYRKVCDVLMALHRLGQHRHASRAARARRRFLLKSFHEMAQHLVRRVRALQAECRMPRRSPRLAA